MSLKLIEAGAFLDSMPEAMPWILEPLMLEGSSMMLYGRQKVGKSSAVTQLIDSLTTGEPWLGFPVRKTGPVIYLQFDMAIMELRRLLERGEDAGLNMRAGVFIPHLGKGEHRVNFNILDEADRKDLVELCDEVKPIAVIVDTINDAYEGENKSGDINAFIRQIHKRFTTAIGDAALIFLNHKRKQMQTFKGEEVDDEDGFLGGSAWGGVATSILELRRQKSDNQIYLELRDLRLDSFPVKRIQLAKDAHGFFVPVYDSGTLLKFWPECLPVADQRSLRSTITSQNDIFRDIATRTGVTFEAVKKQYQRAPGVDYPWKGWLAALEEERRAEDAARVAGKST